MNAQELHKANPIGKIVSFSDGSPQPPARFAKKLRAWRHNNGRGVFTERTAGAPDLGLWPGFRILTSESAMMQMYKHFDIESPKSFEIIG